MSSGTVDMAKSIKKLGGLFDKKFLSDYNKSSSGLTSTHNEHRKYTEEVIDILFRYAKSIDSKLEKFNIEQATQYRIESEFDVYDSISPPISPILISDRDHLLICHGITEHISYALRDGNVLENKNKSAVLNKVVKKLCAYPIYDHAGRQYNNTSIRQMGLHSHADGEPKSSAVFGTGVFVSAEIIPKPENLEAYLAVLDLHTATVEWVESAMKKKHEEVDAHFGELLKASMKFSAFQKPAPKTLSDIAMELRK